MIIKVKVIDPFGDTYDAEIDSNLSFKEVESALLQELSSSYYKLRQVKLQEGAILVIDKKDTKVKLFGKM